MSRIRRVLAYTAVSAASVLVPALPAQAGTMAGHCNITGHADAAVLLVGGAGTYGFSVFSAACFFATEGKTGVFGVATLDITSNGTFTNTICGTGQAGDSDPAIVATVTSTDAQAAASLKAKLESLDWAYHITFVGFQGVLTFTDPDTTGRGHVHISPDGDPPPPGACADGFNVTAQLSFVAEAAP